MKCYLKDIGNTALYEDDIVKMLVCDMCLSLKYRLL